MPNWCRGYLKIRGERNDIRRFLDESLNEYEMNENHEWVKRPKTGDEIFYDTDYIELNFHNDDIYVEGTSRGFICSKYSAVDNWPELGETISVIALEYQQAWGIRTDELAEISKKYNLDFRIFGTECGMEFTQKIDIEKGRIIEDSSQTYAHWLWNVLNPYDGG